MLICVSMVEIEEKTMKKKSRARKRAVLFYKVTGEVSSDGPKMPPELEDKMVKLYYKAQSQPEEALEDLIKLKAKYPSSPQIYNMIGGIYSKLGKSEKANEIAKENYEANPNYLFAKINFANTLLSTGQYEKIPEIFGQRLDLKLLYPDRDTFHISEVLGFLGIIGPYLVLVGDRSLARNCLSVLKRIDPDHPQTQRLAWYLSQPP